MACDLQRKYLRIKRKRTETWVINPVETKLLKITLK